MHIAFVGQPWNTITPGIVHGSIAMWIDRVTTRLADQGHATTIYSGGDKPHTIKDEDREFVIIPTRVDRKFFNRMGKPRYWLGRPGPVECSRAYHRAYAIRVAADLRRHQPDVIHLINLPQFAAPLRRACPNAKLILNMRCDWLSVWPSVIVRRYLPHIDHVMGCSQNVADKAIAAHPELASRCTAVQNGVDTQLFAPDLDEQPDPDHPTIVYVGRVSPEKGTHVLIQAFGRILTKHPSAKLRIIGPIATTSFLMQLGDESTSEILRPFDGVNYEEHLHELAAALPHGSVEFVGPIDNPQLPSHLRRATFATMPSLWEPFGIPVIEALSCGTPVIGARTGGITKTLEGSGAGVLVTPNSVEELAKAMDTLLADTKLRRIMSQAARDHAAEHYSYERVVRQLLEHYNLMLGLSHRSGDT